jgi:hypothetical protein
MFSSIKFVVHAKELDSREDQLLIGTLSFLPLPSPLFTSSLSSLPSPLSPLSSLLSPLPSPPSTLPSFGFLLNSFLEAIKIMINRVYYLAKKTPRPKKFQNPKFLAPDLSTQPTKNLTLNSGPRDFLSYSDISGLAYIAFEKTLQKKQTNFSGVLAYVRQQKKIARVNFSYDFDVAHFDWIIY